MIVSNIHPLLSTKLLLEPMPTVNGTTGKQQEH